MVYLILADGFEEIEALTPVDLLRRANKEVMTTGLTQKEVKGAHGITVIADILLDEIDLKKCEALIIPGGRGYKLILESADALKLIKSVAEQSKYIGAICAAPVILAKNELLNGVKAVCFPSMKDELSSAIWQDVPAVSDGIFITGKAAGCSIEFSLLMIEKLCGVQAAEKVKREICFDN